MIFGCFVHKHFCGILSQIHDDYVNFVFRELLLRELYINYLKGIIWIISNASMWTIKQLERSHFMVLSCTNWSYVFNCTLPLDSNLVLHILADLQLDVKGCPDVYASFDKYVEVERLEGDNKYHAEQYGLQVCCNCLFWNLLVISHL